MPLAAPASLWNKRLILACANKLYQAVNQPSFYMEEDGQTNHKTGPLEPEPFLKNIELKLAQKEEWKQQQKEAWKSWVEAAPAQERGQAFVRIVEKLLKERSLEGNWRELLDRTSVRSFPVEGELCVSESAADIEEIDFLQQLLLLLPKPWRQTEDSFTFCEEVSGEECLKGATKVSWRKIQDNLMERYEIKTVSCAKGFFQNGDCRLGYARTTKGSDTSKVSCDSYFNGKCYGEFRSYDVASDVLCLPQPSSEVYIKQSDFDGTWGYYTSVVDCDGTDYEVRCYRFDPKTLVCQDGLYKELGECMMGYGSVMEMDLDGCVPVTDQMSCEIKNGICVNEKVVKGRRTDNTIKESDLWTALGESEKKEKKKKEFRLTLPAEYAFAESL